MNLQTTSLSTVLWVTAMVAVMVFLLPWADRLVSRKLGINLHGGMSEHPDADRLLRRRQALLTIGFLIYLSAFGYLVFFSRDVSSNYAVHVSFLTDLRDAFSTDHGFSDVLRRIFTEGFASAFANVKLVRPEDLVQFLLNMMLFIPMGYLLPYVFRWFRAHVKIRPVGVCFLISFAVENMQLLFRRGLYDLDDLFSNTLGGLIGQLLYISVAYVVTHPDWRKELRLYRLWKRKSRRRILYPFRRNLGPGRIVLRATDGQAVWDFYVEKLGFRPVCRLGSEESVWTGFLFQAGGAQVEFLCSNQEEELGEQYLTLFAEKLPQICSRLQSSGIQVETYEEDPFTGFRQLRFTGPDHVQITLVENF